MASFVFCTKDCWTGVKSDLKSIEKIVRGLFPGASVSFFEVPSNGFHSSLIHMLKSNPPDFLFIGGWDASMRNIVANKNKHKTKVFLKWCSPITQTELGSEIPLFIDVVNFLQLGLIDYVSCSLESDYNVLKGIHKGFVYCPVTADLGSLDEHRVEKIMSDEWNCDLFCSPNSRKNLFNQILSLSTFPDVKVNVNYTKPEYLEIVKRYTTNNHIHGWMSQPQYRVLTQRMDFSMQVTLSEGYNITAVEHFYYEVPVICSSFLPYIKGSKTFSPLAISDPTNCSEICEKIKWIKNNVKGNKDFLESCKQEIVDFNNKNKNILQNLFGRLLKESYK